MVHTSIQERDGCPIAFYQKVTHRNTVSGLVRPTFQLVTLPRLKTDGENHFSVLGEHRVGASLETGLVVCFGRADHYFLTRFLEQKS